MSDNFLNDIIDSEQLSSLAEAAGVDTVKIILDAFWNSNDTLVQDLKTSITSSNFDEIAKTAHALKGSAANVGASQLADCAKRIEDAAKTNDIAIVTNLLGEFENDISTSREAFDLLIVRLAA